MVPPPMNTMLDKQPREEAIRKQIERSSMVSKDVPPTAAGTLCNEIPWLSCFIIYQIFSLVRNWSKQVTWPNIPHLKLGNIWEYSPIFNSARVAKKIWRIINTIASIWGEDMLRYLSLDIICSSKLTVFLELRSRKTVRFLEQIMSAEKYPNIFSH